MVLWESVVSLVCKFVRVCFVEMVVVVLLMKINIVVFVWKVIMGIVVNICCLFVYLIYVKMVVFVNSIKIVVVVYVFLNLLEIDVKV